MTCALTLTCCTSLVVSCHGESQAKIVIHRRDSFVVFSNCCLFRVLGKKTQNVLCGIWCAMCCAACVVEGEGGAGKGMKGVEALVGCLSLVSIENKCQQHVVQ